MGEPEAFTPDQFEHVAGLIGTGAPLLTAALRIAANAMRPGVLENILLVAKFETTIGEQADAIREALRMRREDGQR